MTDINHGHESSTLIDILENSVRIGSLMNAVRLMRSLNTNNYKHCTVKRLDAFRRSLKADAPHNSVRNTGNNPHIAFIFSGIWDDYPNFEF